MDSLTLAETNFKAEKLAKETIARHRRVQNSLYTHKGKISAFESLIYSNKNLSKIFQY